MTDHEARISRNFARLCFLVGVLSEELETILPSDRSKRLREAVDLFAANLEPMEGAD